MSGKKAVLLAVGFALVLALGGPYLVANVILQPGDRERGQLLACQATLIRIQRCLELYSREHDKEFPPDWTALEPYLQALDPEHQRQLCPVTRQETYKAGYEVSTDRKTCTVVCKGQNHPGVPPDYPRWSSREGLKER